MSQQAKYLLYIPILSAMFFGLAGCNEDSASEKLAKQQLESIADVEMKKKEGKKAILNNTVNPFSFDKKAPTEK